MSVPPVNSASANARMPKHMANREILITPPDLRAFDFFAPARIVAFAATASTFPGVLLATK